MEEIKSVLDCIRYTLLLKKKIINGKVKKLNLFFKSNIGRVIVFIGKPKISEEPSQEDFLDFEIESSEVEIGDFSEYFEIAQSLTSPNSTKGGQFGFAMESADINEDGIDDLIISGKIESCLCYSLRGHRYWRGSNEGLLLAVLSAL